MSIVICDRCGKTHRGNFETCTECINIEIKGWKMNIKKGEKYTNEVGKVVEVIDVVDTKVYFNNNGQDFPRIVTLVLYKHDDMLYVDEVTTFSDEYTLIEPVYEYQYAFEMECGKWTTTDFFTDFEAHRRTNCAFHKLEFTKRERKCQ